jgi:NDP-sugar pyrophosphorylase family protein
MKAMILAAGLGRRLRPLTLDKPKALVEFMGEPLLGRIIRNLSLAGVDRIVVNVHHFATQVIAFLESRNYFDDLVVVSDESNRLMDTGGGLLKAQPLLEDDKPFIVHNVDVHTGLDINRLYRYHTDHGALVTIAVTDRSTSRSLLFDDEGCLAGWQHNQTGERKIVREYAGALHSYANSCVLVISQEFFTRNRLSGTVSLTDIYLDLAREQKITYFEHSRDYWYNLGDYQSLVNAENELKSYSDEYEDNR